MIKLVYIAGKFSGPNAWAIERNVRAAEDLGVQVAQLGAMPIIPHANTRFFHGLEGTTAEFWYEGTLELLRRCDAVVMTLDWEDSKGACAEREEARRLRLPVFFVVGRLIQSAGPEIESLSSWLRKGAPSYKKVNDAT